MKIKDSIPNNRDSVLLLYAAFRNMDRKIKNLFMV